MASDVISFIPSPDRQRDLRNALASFGTGVTVITTQTPDGPLGMTANSFSSVSLEPPLVLWSPAVASRRHAPFASAKTFCIHVLAAHQLSMAQHFAGNGDGFDKFDWSTGPSGAPQLPGCLAAFHCSQFAAYPAGDHTIILGQISHVFQSNDGATGLLFQQGRFGTFLPDA